MSKQSALARMATIASLAVVVDADLAAKLLSACEDGDIDACHLMLLKLQQRHPQSVAVNDNADTMKPSERRALQPLYDLVGHGFATAATRGHVATAEFLLSSQFAAALRDGVCGDARMFPPFAALRDHELAVCVESVRFVCFAALTCVDQLAMPAFQWLVETQALWDHEASVCLALAMRRAVAATVTTTGGPVSPAAFHPMIVLLAKHYAFLIDEIRAFHDQFQPQRSDGLHGLRRLDRVKALQASVLYEIVLSA